MSIPLNIVNFNNHTRVYLLYRCRQNLPSACVLLWDCLFVFKIPHWFDYLVLWYPCLVVHIKEPAWISFQLRIWVLKKLKIEPKESNSFLKDMIYVTRDVVGIHSKVERCFFVVISHRQSHKLIKSIVLEFTESLVRYLKLWW